MSAENAQQEVTKLYISLFGRAPDLEGLNFWSSRIQSGESVASVANQMFSVEPARRFFPEGLEKSGIVNAFYRNVLGRDADADGLTYWSRQMESGKAIGEVLSTIVAATDNYNGNDANGLQSAQLFANKKAVSEAFVQKLSASGVTQTNEVATSVAVSIIEQVKVNTVLNDFISNTVRRAAEFTKVAVENPDEVQKLLPASGSIADLKNIMPQGAKDGDVFEFAKKIVEVAKNPNEVLSIVSVGGQGRLTFNADGQLVNRYGEIMVVDSGGQLAPAPRDIPVGMMRDSSGNFVPDPSFPTLDLFGNPIAPPPATPVGGYQAPDAVAPPTADGRVIMTNQGPMAYNASGQLVNRFGEVMRLDSSGNWAPEWRDTPVGQIRGEDGILRDDPKFKTDIFGRPVTQRYDGETDFKDLRPVVEGFFAAYTPPGVEGGLPGAYIPPGGVPPLVGYVPPPPGTLPEGSVPGIQFPPGVYLPPGYVPPMVGGYVPPNYVPPGVYTPPGYVPPEGYVPPPGPYAPPGYAPQTYTPPAGYAPTVYTPPGYVPPEGYVPPPGPYAPPGYAPQTYTPPAGYIPPLDAPIPPGYVMVPPGFEDQAPPFLDGFEDVLIPAEFDVGAHLAAVGPQPDAYIPPVIIGDPGPQAPPPQMPM